MDHMMPKMDGIETTNRIRSMGYTGSIVALTANAVAGQDRMFMQSGFDEFISKPIDVRQLNKVLNALVRDKHPEKAAAARLKSDNGASAKAEEPQSAIDPFLAALFVKDAGKSLGTINEAMEIGLAADAENLRAYTIHMHGLRGALANIGRAELSAKAKALEDLSRSESNISILEQETPLFASELSALIDELSKGLGAADESREDEPDEDPGLLSESLRLIAEACDEYDDMAIEENLEKLKAMKWSRKSRTLIEGISEQLLLSGFDEIKEAAMAYEAT